MAVDFYFGAMSPYSWFAAERIGELLPQAVWRPVFAGGLFKGAGRVSWGLTDARAAGLADCEERAAARGLGALRWPPDWPTSDVLVARAMIVADRRGRLAPFALAAMRLCFREGAELSDPAVVAEAARRARLDPAVLEETGAPATKAALRDATDAALARGVVGIPTVLVGNRAFWGDDRLDAAAAAAAGD